MSRDQRDGQMDIRDYCIEFGLTTIAMSLYTHFGEF